jgi:aspartate/methionine/tyrosine aminotransferase
VIEAARRALASDRLGYTDALGVPALRSRISRYYAERHGIAVAPERIAVTIGSSGAFLLAFLAAFDVGDRVAVVEPGYPAYRNILSALGIEPFPLVVGPETRFQPTQEQVKAISGRVDGLIVASPSNPTGTMLSRQALKAIAEVCRANGIRFVSDEIYHGITFGEPAATALSFDSEAIVVNSFSKYYSMTGWRLGWLVLPADMVRTVECLAQNLFISAPSLSQVAAVAAFDCTAELDQHVAHYRRNRDILLAGLPEAGLDRLAPADGAFYLYADVSALTNDSDQFCKRLLAETGIAITPGIDFDPRRGHRHVRFSFSGPTDDMRDAIAKLKAWRHAGRIGHR